MTADERRIHDRLIDWEGEDGRDGRNDIHRDVMQLESAGCLGLRRDRATDFDHALVLDIGETLFDAVILSDSLGHAIAVTQDHKADLAKGAKLVQPSLKDDGFANVQRQFGGSNSLHLILLRNAKTPSSWSERTRGLLVVPPFFAAGCGLLLVT
jgi:hypothetical protein